MRGIFVRILGASTLAAIVWTIALWYSPVPNEWAASVDPGDSPSAVPASMDRSGAGIGTLSDMIKSERVLASTETPVPPAPDMTKHIVVTLKTQTLQYFEGDRKIGEFKISSGIRSMPTPPGEYTVLVKKPVVHYKGPDYDFPNTKWNLMFKANVPLNYYIHGAYWHHNFGHPMSHGCVNVAYADMGPFYDWADVGTRITIQ